MIKNEIFINAMSMHKEKYAFWTTYIVSSFCIDQVTKTGPWKTRKK